MVISGTGLYTPPDVIDNEQLVASFNAYTAAHNDAHAAEIAAGVRPALAFSSAEFIEKASGIRQRHVLDSCGILDTSRMYPRFPQRADDDLSLQAEIAVAAAREALQQAGRQSADIDLVICAASSMQRSFPAISIEIQNALGIEGSAYDMTMACSSATFGIEQAANAIRSGTARAVLLVIPEVYSARLAWHDRDCHFIFGDACSAVVIERADEARAGSWEILDTRTRTRFSNAIRNNFGPFNRCEDSDPAARDKLFRQQGRRVFKEVCPMVVEHVGTHLAELDLTPTAIRRFWLHQANATMNHYIVKHLLGREPHADEAPSMLAEYGNTAAVGSLMAFHFHRHDLAAGSTGIICSFGAGYSVGSIIVRRL